MVDAETCSAYEICVERRQVSAIRVENESAIVDKNRCIGCGLCVSSCPTGSITMAHKSPEEFSVILKDQTELLQTMGKEKRKAYPFQ